MSSVEERRRQRFQFLRLVYWRTDGNPMNQVHGLALGGELGWDEQKAEGIIRYLVDEGLLKIWAFGYVLGVTHQGVRRVEGALEQIPGASSPDLAALHGSGAIASHEGTAAGAGGVAVHGNVSGSVIAPGGQVNVVMQGQEQGSAPTPAPPVSPRLILKLYQMGRDRAHQDEITIDQQRGALHQEYLFGLALYNTEPFTKAEGVQIRLQIANRTTTQYAVTLQAPAATTGWVTQVPGLNYVQMADLKFDDRELLCLHRHPVCWDDFRLGLVEPVDGYFTIYYDVTSVQPLTENHGELTIRMA
jgi:hypothetical protein